MLETRPPDQVTPVGEQVGALAALPQWFNVSTTLAAAYSRIFLYSPEGMVGAEGGLVERRVAQREQPHTQTLIPEPPGLAVRLLVPETPVVLETPVVRVRRLLAFLKLYPAVLLVMGELRVMAALPVQVALVETVAVREIVVQVRRLIILLRKYQQLTAVLETAVQVYITGLLGFLRHWRVNLVAAVRVSAVALREGVGEPTAADKAHLPAVVMPRMVVLLPLLIHPRVSPELVVAEAQVQNPNHQILLIP